MEKNPTALTGEITDCLEKLKNSPIVQQDYYCIQLANLSDVISTIASDAMHTIELINSEMRKDKKNLGEHLIEELQKRFFLMMTVADVINEKVTDKDYTELDNLFYYYKKQ